MLRSCCAINSDIDLLLQHFNPLLLPALLSQDRSTGWLVVMEELWRHSELSFTAASTAPAHGHLSSVSVRPCGGLRQMTTGLVGRTHPSAERSALSFNFFTFLSCLYASISLYPLVTVLFTMGSRLTTRRCLISGPKGTEKVEKQELDHRGGE